METLNYIAVILWSIHIVKSIMFNAYLWQLKEYRLDRLFAYFQTDTGQKIFLNPFLILKVVLFAYVFYTQILNLVLLIFILIYFIELIFTGVSLLRHKFFRPVFTGKIIAILMVSIAITLFPLFRLNNSFTLFFTYLLAFDLFFPVLMAFLVALINLLSKFVKQRYIALAREKVKKHKNLKVIGITGSYGKTTTKEYLNSILSPYFNVLKTPQNINTEIGIAKTIMEELNSDHEVFIVEMGAYKKGEIKDICDLVSPQIGVLTGIGTQHLALFKTLENTINTKFELIDSLPEYGTAIFNVDNPHIEANLNKAKCNVVLYSIQGKGDINAKNILVEGSDIKFDIQSKKIQGNMKFNALGVYNVSNLLGAIGVALEFGLSYARIKEAVEGIHPYAKTMKPYRGINNSLIIDDSYNANTEGVILAIEYLSHYSGRKYLVMSNIFELGKSAVKDHIKVGEVAGKYADKIYITDLDYSKYILEGLSHVDFDLSNILVETDMQIIREDIVKDLEPQDVVLLEGRGPGRLLNFLKA